jgi:hypothetical protein
LSLPCSHDLQEALEYLKASSKHITDKAVIRELTLQLYVKLGRPEAEAMARELFGKNPDNRDYLLALENACGLSKCVLRDRWWWFRWWYHEAEAWEIGVLWHGCSSAVAVAVAVSQGFQFFYCESFAHPPRSADPEKRLAFHQALETQFPNSRVLRRMPLTLAAGDAFVKLADDYLRKGLRKGIVSLFRSIQSLYSSAEKVAVDALRPFVYRSLFVCLCVCLSVCVCVSFSLSLSALSLSLSRSPSLSLYPSVYLSVS